MLHRQPQFHPICRWVTAIVGVELVLFALFFDTIVWFFGPAGTPIVLATPLFAGAAIQYHYALITRGFRYYSFHVGAEPRLVQFMYWFTGTSYFTPSLCCAAETPFGFHRQEDTLPNPGEMPSTGAASIEGMAILLNPGETKEEALRRIQQHLDNGEYPPELAERLQRHLREE